jgi:hypothetical protein
MHEGVARSKTGPGASVRRLCQSNDEYDEFCNRYPRPTLHLEAVSAHLSSILSFPSSSTIYRPCQSLPAIPMTSTNQTAGPSTSTSTDSFIAIYNAASTEYQRVTGKHPQTHPFAAQLDACHSSKAVSDLLRTQTQAFSTFRKGDDKLMAWLDPIVNILFTFSGTIGEGICLVNRFNTFDMAVL